MTSSVRLLGARWRHLPAGMSQLPVSGSLMRRADRRSGVLTFCGLTLQERADDGAMTQAGGPQTQQRSGGRARVSYGIEVTIPNQPWAPVGM